MDTFNEQIVKINNTPKTIALKVLIWIAAIMGCGVLVYFIKIMGALAAVVAFLLFKGAVKLSGLLNIEYEYILTNGELDVDKIIAQNSRKRLFTIDCKEIEAIGKYRAGMKLNGKLFMCCNEKDEAYYIVARNKQGEQICLVFAPGEKLKNGIKIFLPRFIQKGAFED